MALYVIWANTLVWVTAFGSTGSGSSPGRDECVKPQGMAKFGKFQNSGSSGNDYSNNSLRRLRNPSVAAAAWLYPKPFLPLADKSTMVQATVRRLEGMDDQAPLVLCKEEDRFMVA